MMRIGVLRGETKDDMVIKSESSRNSSRKQESHSYAHESETKLTKQDDSGYFGGYSHYSIHETMLKDRPRTESYRDALETCDLKGKIVLDVGCGTGILSMFAARHGAKHVIGIDRSDIIDEARIIVKQNGLEDKITLIKGKLEDIVLPSNIAPGGTR